MDLSELLDPERIRCHCQLQSKKRTLQTLAELLGQSIRAAQSADPEVSEESAEPRKTGLLKKNSDKTADTDSNATDTLTDMEILDALISRERLGSTGLGHGVALPHSRMSTIEKPVAAFLTLSEGVDYESADDQPVDLVLGLLVPEECNDEHLKILRSLATRFSDEQLRETLRSFDSEGDLYQHLTTLPDLHH